MSMRQADTIVALATARAVAAIAVVRMSGPDAFSLARKCMGTLPAPRQASLRNIVCDGVAVDQALVLSFGGPDTHTGEDVVEFHLHGNPGIADQLIAFLCHAGARLAEPGEFTRRAVLHGRMDVHAAEAVNALVHAATQEAAAQALGQLGGLEQTPLLQWERQLVEQLGQVEAWVDFADEDIEPDSVDSVRERLRALVKGMQEELQVYRASRAWRSGLRILIVGEPNVGKSTLLNALLGQERALVSEQAGTTRDYIEAHHEIGGIPVSLVDTAGLRSEGAGAIEQQGIDRVSQLVQEADLVIWLRHPDELRQDPGATLAGLLGHPVAEADRRVIAVTGFADKSAEEGIGLCISPRTGQGLDQLEQQIVGRVVHPDFRQLSLVSDRQAESLSDAAAAVERGIDALAAGQPAELVAEELYAALKAFGILRGDYDRDRTLDVIFSAFCIGK